MRVPSPPSLARPPSERRGSSRPRWSRRLASLILWAALTGLAASVVLLLAAPSGCSSEDSCQVSSQCPAHHHCDFENNVCVLGCQSDAECGYGGHCAPRYGICRAGDVQIPNDAQVDVDCGVSGTRIETQDGGLACVLTSTTSSDASAPSDGGDANDVGD